MSKKRKPLSLDEKKETLMGILYASGEVFNMKELLKHGSSAGVVENTIEDIVKGLVAERLISDDKIGSGAFFWSFPSTAFLQRKARVAALEGELAAEEAARGAAEARAAALSEDAAAAEARAGKLAELEALRARRAELEAAAKARAENDPTELLARVKRCKECADRWTDNLLALKAYCVKKFGMGAKEAEGSELRPPPPAPPPPYLRYVCAPLTPSRTTNRAPNPPAPRACFCASPVLGMTDTFDYPT